jgi:hypothetical protein
MSERRKETMRRFLDDEQTKLEELFRTSQLPHYGLPPLLQEQRMVGTYRTAAGGAAARNVDTVTIQYELIHGDPLERTLRLLIVATSEIPPLREPTPLRHLLWERVVAERAAMRPKRKLFGSSMPKREDVGGSERLLAVPIDQTPWDFTLIEEGVVQAAELMMADHRIIIKGHRWPIESIELVTVTDLAPYLEGRRRYTVQRQTDMGS